MAKTESKVAATVRFKPGDWLVVKPVGSAMTKAMPASKIKKEMTVKVLDEGASGGLDVYDVEYPDGTEDSIYGTQVVSKGKKPAKTAGDRELFHQLQRIASAHPETRVHLVPVLQKFALLGKQATINDHDTLSQLVDMEVESIGATGEVGEAEWEAVNRAAESWDHAVEKALLTWLKNPENKAKLNMATPLLARVHRDQDIVDVFMEHRGGAGYLYYMEMEGHGVGTWDGDWDKLFLDHDKTIHELSQHMKQVLSGEHRKLHGAIQNAAYSADEGGDEGKYASAGDEMMAGRPYTPAKGPDGAKNKDYGGGAPSMGGAGKWEPKNNKGKCFYQTGDPKDRCYVTTNGGPGGQKKPKTAPAGGDGSEQRKKYNEKYRKDRWGDK